MKNIKAVKSSIILDTLSTFFRIADLRCTPREYGSLPILRAVNDAVPDESLAVGNFANSAEADRGFFEQKWGCFSRDGKIGGF